MIITIPENSAETARKEELFENAIDEGNNARDDRDYVKAESAYKRAASIPKGWKRNFSDNKFIDISRESASGLPIE